MGVSVKQSYSTSPELGSTATTAIVAPLPPPPGSSTIARRKDDSCSVDSAPSPAKEEGEERSGQRQRVRCPRSGTPAQPRPLGGERRMCVGTATLLACCFGEPVQVRARLQRGASVQRRELALERARLVAPRRLRANTSGGHSRRCGHEAHAYASHPWAEHGRLYRLQLQSDSTRERRNGRRGNRRSGSAHAP